MIILMHVDTMVVDDLNDNHLYTFPPGEPVEVENDFIAKRILEHKWYHGMVEVPQIRSKGGVKYDIETASKMAKEKLASADKKMLDEYVKNQMEDRIMRNFPPVPPSGRYKYVIDKYNVDLKQYGINLIGPGQDMDKVPTLQTGHTAEMQALINDNRDLKQRLDRILGMVERGELVSREAAANPKTPRPAQAPVEILNAADDGDSQPFAYHGEEQEGEIEHDGRESSVFSEQALANAGAQGEQVGVEMTEVVELDGMADSEAEPEAAAPAPRRRRR